MKQKLEKTEAPPQITRKKKERKIRQNKGLCHSHKMTYKSLRSRQKRGRRGRTSGYIILVHAQMLHKVVMSAKIFVTARVRASMSYMRQTIIIE